MEGTARDEDRDVREKQERQDSAALRSSPAACGQRRTLLVLGPGQSCSPGPTASVLFALSLVGGRVGAAKGGTWGTSGASE